MVDTYPGNLIPLIAEGAMNQLFPNNFSTNSNLINATSNANQTINRTCDAIIIDGLIIPKTVNLNNIQNFQIIIGGQIIYNLPFDIINNIFNIKDTNNNYIISIKKELLVFNSSNDHLKNNLIIPLIALQFHDVNFNLISLDHFEYKIIAKNINYQNNIRQSLATNQHYCDIYQYQEFDINNSENIITPQLVSIGLYIKLNDKLSNYKLYLNEHINNVITEELIEFYNFLSYKKEEWTIEHSNALNSSLNKYLPTELILLIESFIDKNNEYLYYIPFNLCNNITTDGTINFSRIDNVKIKLITKNNNYNGKIYIKNINRLQIRDGLCALIFAPL